ncbi:hypothetical protein B0T17DRAFT_614411 [Bombardia bombarda]|uniref:Zn(2)-C6 fungal-type domain-containing protein n=1 Tax=Bombardia bombarda TaxID=252184 RepID=A0AA40C7K5_9PEZI|nr:hypothetical protein B0T17DRAFT_614411 [Bombardia bombarda]
MEELITTNEAASTAGSAEVAAAASRQKSCNACVKSKRRCDKRAPVCTRCAERREICVYAKRRRSSSGGTSPEPGRRQRNFLDFDELVATGSSSNRADLDTSSSGGGGGLSYTTTAYASTANSAADRSPFSMDPLPHSSSIEFDFLDLLNQDHPLPNPATSVSYPAPLSAAVVDGNGDACADMGMHNIDPFLNFMGNSIDAASGSSSDMWLVQTEQPGLLVERPGTPADEEIQSAYEKMDALCSDFEAWQLYEPSTRAHYFFNRIKGLTADFAAANATCFLHRHLYKDHAPPYILACFSTSVMYTNRTAANKGMVMRTLQRNVDDFHAQTSSANTTNSVKVVVTPQEKLARAQTLCLYQTIRLFDGDVTLRTQGERDLPLFETWLAELCRLRENLSDLGGAARLEDGRRRELVPPKDWERWIFAESVRRTIIMAYSMLSMYDMLKGSVNDGYNDNDEGPWSYVHRWTLSRHLWEAESSSAFYRMWEEKPRYIISNYSLDEFLKHGKGDDVDEFAKILLTAYMGQDETEAFISGKGGVGGGVSGATAVF